MRKIVIAILLLFSGCAQKKTYYAPHIPLQSCCSKQLVIGVEDVEVPDYLLQDRVVVKEAKEHFIPFRFVEDPRESLTKAFIEFLQNYFQGATIFHYPWQGGQTSCKVALALDALYIQKGSLFLVASLRIKQKVAHFLIKEPIDTLPKAVDRALKRLFIQAAQAVDRSCQ